MKSVQFFGILSFVIVLSFSVFSQTKTISIVTQDGAPLNMKYRYSYRFLIDGVDQGKITLEQSRLELPYPDSLIQVEIEGARTQRYYNEFKPSDIETLEMVELFVSDLRGTKTPRFFRESIFSTDANVIDSFSWFPDWLTADERIKGYQIEVNNARRLKLLERRRIKKIHKEIDAYLGRTSELIFTNVPYTATDEDVFNSGTKITSDFIVGQNTDYMKRLAKNYSIVMVLIVQWDDDEFNH